METDCRTWWCAVWEIYAGEDFNHNVRHAFAVDHPIALEGAIECNMHPREGMSRAHVWQAPSFFQYTRVACN